MSRYAERANALLLDGCAPYQFTYHQLAGGHDAAATVVATFRRALEAFVEGHTTT